MCPFMIETNGERVRRGPRTTIPTDETLAGCFHLSSLRNAQKHPRPGGHVEKPAIRRALHTGSDHPSPKQPKLHSFPGFRSCQSRASLCATGQIMMFRFRANGLPPPRSLIHDGQLPYCFVLESCTFRSHPLETKQTFGP